MQCTNRCSYAEAGVAYNIPVAVAAAARSTRSISQRAAVAQNRDSITTLSIARQPQLSRHALDAFEIVNKTRKKQEEVKRKLADPNLFTNLPV